MPQGVTRRRLIAMSLLGFGGLALQGCAKEGGDSILVHLKASPGVAEVGQAYLAANPSENDAAQLAQQLRLERDWSYVEEDIRDDYRNDRVTLLTGWPISQTEGRLYALVSLQVNP
jgi:hypothetical protein